MLPELCRAVRQKTHQTTEQDNIDVQVLPIFPRTKQHPSPQKKKKLLPAATVQFVVFKTNLIKSLS